MAETLITGVGVTSAIGQGREAFANALFGGRSAFGAMAREGRQWCADAVQGDPGLPFLGAEIAGLRMPPDIPRKLLRTASWSAQVALATLHEAWHDARLDELAPERIGLVVGGSNFQQRESMRVRQARQGQPWFLPPGYGHTFMDSDLTALCTEVFGIHGPAWSVGAASASGQMAVIQAIDAVAGGRVDACIALGAPMDVSCWELQALRNLGAMGSDRFHASPSKACRPFDAERDGFIYGEACAAVVVERAVPSRASARPYARCAGSAVRMDGNRHPNPSLEGEIVVIQEALRQAGWAASQIDYVNPHGTASPLGDETELQALRRCGLGHARINATKSLTGHGLTAAGAVEVVATVLQMKASRLHPTLNLESPIDADWPWVFEEPVAEPLRRALTLSIGFGGINTALCLQC